MGNIRVVKRLYSPDGKLVGVRLTNGHCEWDFFLRDGKVRSGGVVSHSQVFDPQSAAPTYQAYRLAGAILKPARRVHEQNVGALLLRPLDRVEGESRRIGPFRA